MVKSLFKLCAIYILKLFMILLHVFPVKNNRIIFNSYSGRQYACNPKYISMYLNENYEGQYELIWAIRNASSYKWLTEEGIKVVEYYSLKRLFYEATAKVSINNVGSFSWMPNTKNQLRINTWHGGGCYKKVGLGEKQNDFIMKKTIAMTAKNTSYMLASSKYNAEIVWPQDLGYHGEVLRIGFPRNDIFFGNNAQQVREKVCSVLDIPKQDKILMYAPTWRYGTSDAIILPDFDRLRLACTKRFGGEWTVLFRAHDLTTKQWGKINCKDVSNYADMQELLIATDFLISDYSSCIWDYSLQITKPCILFVPDLSQYEEMRGFDIDIHTWGFPICANDKEAEDAIASWDELQYANNMKMHHDSLQSYDKGNACYKLAKIIEQFCFGKG